jgi:hypothetical protein
MFSKMSMMRWYDNGVPLQALGPGRHIHPGESSRDRFQAERVENWIGEI